MRANRIRTAVPIWTVLWACVAVVCMAAEDGGAYTVRAYWTDSPPTLDGRMNKACWAEAQVITDFRMFQKPEQAATQQTEVRVCYDATNLYVFWKLYEARMDKLAYGPPEDMRDMLDFSGDVAELFLDPGKTRERMVQLCSSPLGTRYDGSSKRKSLFNPDWTVVPSIHEDHWALEMAIPFVELAHEGEFAATPQPGEEWGIQFCRDQAHLHEWTQWKPTPRSFHEVDKYGTLVFMGRRDGGKLPEVRRISQDLLHFGPGMLEFTVDAAGQELTVNYELSRNGKTVERRSATVVRGRLGVPYHIVQGGEWRVRVTLNATATGGGRLRKLWPFGRAADGAVYVCGTFTNLPPIRQTLTDIEKSTRTARDRLGDFRHPAATELTDRLSKLTQAAQAPLERIRTPEALPREDWERVTADVQHLDALWQGVRFDLHLVGLYPRTSTDTAFAVGVAGPHEKVYRDTRYQGSLDDPIRIALAGGEYESFQLVVIPFWRQLDAVTVTFADLEGPGGTVPAENLSYRLVDYVRLEGIDPNDATINEYEPDILWPGKPFNVPNGQVRSVWVDVLLPRGLPAGDYTGSITVSAAGQSVEKPLLAHAYGFDLPPFATLENNFWFGPTNYNWGRFYGAGHYGDKSYTPEMYERHAQVLSRYRITCFADCVLSMSPHFRIYREPDGHYSFDFSTWEEFIRIGLKYGSNAWRAALSCNLGAMYLFREHNKVIDRKTGEEIQIKEVMADWFVKKETGEAYWDSHPIYRDYLRAYIAFMQRMGILEMATWEIYDEPNSNPRWLDMIRHHKFLREFAPELKLMNYGVAPTQRKAGKTALGLIDVWGPHLPGITPEMLDIMQQRRNQFGEKYWFYTCSSRRDKDGNTSPYLYYHHSYLAPRIHGWFAWKLRADGMLIYALNSIPKDNVKPKARDQQWPNSEWRDGKQRGCGTLVYPGPDFEMIPSMRLASVRDGLEDYEYLHRLHDLLRYVDRETHADLGTRIEQELTIEDSLIGGYYHWTKDQGLLDAKRERLARLIREAMTMIAEK